jgi:hypothetical protein
VFYSVWCQRVNRTFNLNVSELLFAMLSVYLKFSEMLNSDDYKLEAFDAIDSWCLKLS